MKNMDAAELVRLYGLKAHPEGGYFSETYRSPGRADFPGLGVRNFSTAIYFLLDAGARSRLHRIKSDELWHFHLGGPLAVAQIYPDGRAENTILGTDLRAGQRLQHAVPAGCWFGARPCEGTEFAFVSCTVAPGFDFADFELGSRAELLKQFPGAAELIKELTD
jgi:hypothetical protein